VKVNKGEMEAREREAPQILKVQEVRCYIMISCGENAALEDSQAECRSQI
jgi:hypothetical protein